MLAPKDSGTLRILLVESSPSARRRMRNFISGAGALEIVGETATATGALELFHRREPDAVVSELQLEDGTSGSVLREIKQARPDCVVIVLTNFTGPECRARCRELGADYFFDKFREVGRVSEVLSALRHFRLVTPPPIAKTAPEKLAAENFSVRSLVDVTHRLWSGPLKPDKEFSRIAV